MKTLEILKKYLEVNSLYEKINRITVNTQQDLFDSNDSEIKMILLKNFNCIDNYYGLHINHDNIIYIGDYCESQLESEKFNEDIDEILEGDLNIKDLNEFILGIIKTNKINCII